MRKATHSGKGAAKDTPIRRALKTESSLLNCVEKGLAAMNQHHTHYIDQSIRARFADSLEIDENLKDGRETENRWDYLLGIVGNAGRIIGLEPHSAKSDQVSKVIKKRERAIEQLKPHLLADAYVADWLWVASGGVEFAQTDKVRRRLDQHGIKFIGRRLLKKHLQDL
jgi:hypothetical protein